MNVDCYAVCALSVLACACSGPMGGDDAGQPAADGSLDDAGGPDAGAPSDLGVVTHYRGVYFVPERTDVSTYGVDEVTWTVVGDTVTLAYNLPRMLVGDSQRVAFSGVPSGDTAALRGPHGTATCALGAGGEPASCLERFVGLTVDLDRVRREAMDADPSNVEARVGVSTRFSNDPIGVLEPTALLGAPVARARCAADPDCPTGDVCHVEIVGEPGLCESSAPGTGVAGSPCVLDEQCAPPLECDLPPVGTEGVCAASGR